MKEIDRWIVRRLIEQSAEDIDQPLRDIDRAEKTIDWGFTERLARNPMLPDPTELGGPDPDTAVTEFVANLGSVFKSAYDGDRSTLEVEVKSRIDGYLKSFGANPGASTLAKLAERWRLPQRIESLEEFKKAVVSHLVDQVIRLANKVKDRLTKERVELQRWLLQDLIILGGDTVYRYWRSEPESTDLVCQCPSTEGSVKRDVSDERLCSLTKQYRIIVYGAVPPESYPRILEKWSPYAERIALEKPVAGLLGLAP